MARLTRQIDWLGDGTNSGYDRQVVLNAKGQVASETVTTKRGSDIYTDYTTNSYGTGTAYALGQFTQVDTQGYKNGSDSAAPDPRTINSYGWSRPGVGGTPSDDMLYS